VERPEIIKILVESLHCPDHDERRVACEFLREIVTRRGESLTNRSRAALHLALHQTSQLGILAAGSDLKAAPAGHPLRKTRLSTRPARNLAKEGYRSARRSVLLAWIAAANGYLWTRDALVSCTAGAINRISAARTFLVDTVAGALAVIYAVRAEIVDTAIAASTAAIDAAQSAYTGVIGAVTAVIAVTRNGVETACSAASGFVVLSVTRSRDTARLWKKRAADHIGQTRAAVTRRYIGARDAVLTIVARIVDRVVVAYRSVRQIYAEIRRHAVRQVLPQPATPFIVAGLVCLVLFVFGINSYFVISDVNRKGIFMDLSRYEWGDEALASILIGEGYDIYLNEKITEKRIKELLESGHYYERIIRVTGYYSPLPDQVKFATGSYRGDIILNGRGIMGSDTTPVYIGMAAGPPHMEFGTNVIIEDLGKFNLPKIYTIHDRGGAINGNRLDIWVGKGEQAMKKAYEITGYYKVIVVGDK
jgi:3D (Asp-Asp-Asp) domain-containing protein